MRAATAKTWAALLGASLLTGCVGVRDHRGAVIDTELVTAIQVGVDNKESVERTLGRPTFTGSFDANDWYYVSRDTKTVAFRNPNVLDQTVLRVRFDQAGNVVAVSQTGEELIANIRPSGDKTPTLGRERSIFNDIFGNIGAAALPGTTPPRGQ